MRREIWRWADDGEHAQGPRTLSMAHGLSMAHFIGEGFEKRKTLGGDFSSGEGVEGGQEGQGFGVGEVPDEAGGVGVVERGEGLVAVVAVDDLVVIEEGGVGADEEGFVVVGAGDVGAGVF